MKTLSLKVPDDLDARLAAAARERRTTKSTLVRDALREALARRCRSGRTSCLARASDLAGCVSGPADLSVNKRRLAGYGR